MGPVKVDWYVYLGGAFWSEVRPGPFSFGRLGGARLSLVTWYQASRPESLAAVGVVRITVWGPVQRGWRGPGDRVLSSTWSPGDSGWREPSSFPGCGSTRSACSLSRVRRRVKRGRYSAKGGDFPEGRCVNRKGLPYSSSKGVKPVFECGVVRMRVRAKGRRSTQECRTSEASLVRWVLRIPLARSTLPED